MATDEALRQQARTDCLAHAREDYGDDVVVTLGESRRAWNSVLLREIFRQPMVIWRRAHDVEIVLDAATDQPVGFVDHAAWEGCTYLELTRDEILSLAAATGFTDRLAAVAEVRQGPRGCVEARLRSTLPGRRPDLRVRINPAARTVIAIEPADAAQEAP